MIIVNPIYINEFLSPIIGGADSVDDVVNYSYYNSDVEIDVKQFAKKYLISEFDNQIQELKLEAKNALAFYLCFEKVDFESVFNSLLLPLETPKNPRLFFLWIWEVFYPGESYEYIKSVTVKEDFDVEAPLKLIKKLRGNTSK
jgi:hypothetical protein